MSLYRKVASAIHETLVEEAYGVRPPATEGLYDEETESIIRAVQSCLTKASQLGAALVPKIDLAFRINLFLPHLGVKGDFTRKLEALFGAETDLQLRPADKILGLSAANIRNQVERKVSELFRAHRTALLDMLKISDDTLSALQKYVAQDCVGEIAGRVTALRNLLSELQEIKDDMESAKEALDENDVDNAIYYLESASLACISARNYLDGFARLKSEMKTDVSYIEGKIQTLLSEIREEVGGGLPEEVVGSRVDAANAILKAVSGLTFTHKGKEYTVNEILNEVKRELREALGGEAVAFATVYGDTDLLLDSYKGAVKRWLLVPPEKGAFYHFVSKVYGDVGIVDAATLQRIAETVSDKIVGALRSLIPEIMEGVSEGNPLDAELKAKKAKLDEALKRALVEATELLYQTTPPKKKISPSDALAYWKGREVLINNILSSVGKIVAGLLSERRETGYLVYYITTKLNDYFYLGTEKDANIHSCFWTTTGDHSIPSILVGRNVAVCYVFHCADEKELKRMGCDRPPSPSETVKFYPKAIWSEKDAIARTLLTVGADGTLTKTARGNTHTVVRHNAMSDVIWGGLRSILEREFANFRFSPTEWYYIEPSH